MRKNIDSCMTLIFDELAQSLSHISNEIDLKELLNYQGICYWWLIDLEIYYNLTPDNVNIWKKKSNQVKQYLFRSPIVSLINDSCMYAVTTVLVNRFRKKSSVNKSINIQLHNVLYQWRKNNYENRYINNYYFDIVRQFPTDIKTISTLVDPYDIITTIANFRKIKTILEKETSDIEFMANYWSIKCWIQKIRARCYLNKIWRSIQKEDAWFQRIAQYLKMDCDDVKYGMKHIIKDLLLVNINNNILEEKFIQKKRPSVIIISQEQVSFGRGLINLGRKYSIPTMGLQHGLLSELHPSYVFHTSEDMPNTHSCDNAGSFPIPTITSVWGNYDYLILTTHGHYPKSKVIITGNQRYDSLVNAAGRYSREQFCNRNNIELSDKIILWTTQAQANSQDENRSYFDEVFSAISSMNDNTVLIIKQHPLEAERELNIIRQYQQAYPKVKLIIPEKDCDTTELIFISDLIIMKDSTSGQEAVVFNKPMVIMDFSTGVKDTVHYVSTGVAESVYEPGLLYDKISNLLSIMDDELHKKQNAYIKEFLYKIDGGASKRCVDVVFSLLKEKT